MPHKAITLQMGQCAYKSGTLSDYGYAYTLQSVIEVFIVALTPLLAGYDLHIHAAPPPFTD